MEANPATGPAATPATTAEDREVLRGTLRAFFAEHCTEDAVRRLMTAEPGHDPAVWTLMTRQLGLTALGLPEEYGGVGGPAELAVACTEAGRALLGAPLLSTLLAGQAVLAAGDPEACADVLPRIADGMVTGTVAVAEPDGRWRPDAYATAAWPVGEAWELHGTKTFVLDALTADLIVVVAQTGEGPGLFAVENAFAATGLTRRGLAALDLTRRQGRLDFAGTPARRLDRGDGAAAVSRVLDIAAVLLAAEQVGGARYVLEQTTAYARTRVQFGRPIGSFQAVKHKLADVLIRVESADSAAFGAVAAWEADDAELPLVAALAKAYCSEAYVHAAQEAVQVHGGIGFTWEHWAHLYLKRARSTRELFDAPRVHRERMAGILVAPLNS